MANLNSHEPPMSRAATVFAHSIPALVVVALAMRVVFLVTNQWWVADNIASISVVVGIFALIFHLRRGGLCLRCIRNAPLDPERGVRRNKLFLQMIHMRTKTFWVWYAACYVSAIASAFVHGAVAILFKLPLDVLFFSAVWSAWQHHRLQPWCPYCRGWDEGGDEELVPDPDPSETATR